jgi:hypothetical protein
MERIVTAIRKYWFIISLISTAVSSAATGAWYLIGRMEKGEATVASLQSWVQDHDDAIASQHDDILVLKEDERLREAGKLR